MSFSIDAVAEFEDCVEDMYDFADEQALSVDTLIHENGAAQLEINFNHGDPLDMADQVFVFKRTVRETAQRHNMYAGQAHAEGAGISAAYSSKYFVTCDR